MQIPRYKQSEKLTTDTGISKSLAGEKRTAPKVPVTEELVWSTMKTAADKVTDIGNKLKQAEDTMEYQDSIIKLKDGYANIKNDLQTNADYNEYSTKEYEERNISLSSKLQSNVLSGIKSSSVKSKVELAARDMGIGSRTVAQSIGYNKFIDRSRGTTMTQLDNLVESFIVDGDVKDMGYVNAIIDGQTKAGIFSEQEGVRLRDTLTNKAVSGHYENLINLEPIAMYESLVKKGDEPEDWKLLDNEYKNRLKSKATTAYNKETLSIKADTIGTWENMSIDNEVDTWNKFKALDRNYFRMLNNHEYARLKGALKPNPVGAGTSIVNPVFKGRLDRERDAIIAQADKSGLIAGAETLTEHAKELYAGVKHGELKAQAYIEDALYTMSESVTKYNVADIINKKPLAVGKEHLNNLIKSAATSGDGSPIDGKLRGVALDSAQKAYSEKINLVKTDSKKLYNSVNKKSKAPDNSILFEKNPNEDKMNEYYQKAGAYYTKVDDWYTEQGVPKQARRFLTNDETSFMIDNLERTSSDNIVTKINSIEKLYGKVGIYKEVLNELNMKGLPTSLSIIADLPANKRNTIGIDIATSYKVSDAEFTKSMGPDPTRVKKKVTAAIDNDEELESWTNSVFTTGSTSNNIKMVGDVKTTIKRLSYLYTTKGMKEKDAVKKASNEVIGNKYNYIEDDNRTLRIPIDTDKRAMRKTLSNSKDKVKLSPMYFNTDATGTVKKRLNDQINKQVIKTSYWVNYGEVGAFELHDANDLPVFDENNIPIRVDVKGNRLIPAVKR